MATNRLKTCLFIATLFLTPVSAAIAQTTPPLDHGTLARSCAPWDGAAVRFELTPAAAKYPQIGFSLFTDAAAVKTGAYALPLDGHDGSVNYCLQQNNCQLIDKGEIKLLEFTPWKTARIAYDLTLDDGTALKGEATLTGAGDPVFCG